MSNDLEDFGAKRRNAEECERAAATIRLALGGLENTRMPPIMQMLESARNLLPEANTLAVVVHQDDEMGEADAFAIPEKQEIHFGASFAQRAMDDLPDARFVGLHELMHVVFHSGAPRYFRMSTGNVLCPFIHDKHESAEWQADRMTRAVFMPKEMVTSCKDTLTLAQRAGVPLCEAAARMKELSEVAARVTPIATALKIAALASANAKGTTEYTRLKAQELKLKLWCKLPTIEGEAPTESRKCGPFRIAWKEFGKTTECGWFIEKEQIVSFFSTRNC